MAEYYKEVKVCGVCFKAYTTFDWARKLLGLDDAHGAGADKMSKKKAPMKYVDDERALPAAPLIAFKVESLTSYLVWQKMV